MAKSKATAVVLLILISLAVFLPQTGRMSLWDRDEACNSECAREMLESHDPIVPRINWRLRVDKPPMEYWLMMASYKVFGIKEFSARLPSVIAGTLTVVTTYFLAEYLVTGTGLIAALLMVLNLHFPIIAKAATPDALLILFETLALFMLLMDKELLGFAFMGLAVLTKGPIGFIIPYGVKTLQEIFSKKKLYIPKLASVLTFALIALPWYIAVDIKTHHKFSKGFFLYHNITRFIKPIGGHKGPTFYYIIVIILAFLPWCWAIWPGIKMCFEKALKKDEKWLFVYFWMFLPFVFFSLARTKLPNYIVPIYPAFAVTLAPVVLERKSLFKKTAIIVFILLLALQFTLVPKLEKLKPSPIFAKEILASDCKNYTIVTHPFFYPSLIWYTHHKVIRVRKRYQLPPILSSSKGCIFIVTKRSRLEKLKKLGLNFEILDERKSLYPHGKLVLLKLIRRKTEKS